MLRTSILSALLIPLALSTVDAQQPTPGKLGPLPAPLPRTNTPKPTTGPITPEDLKTRLYIFADDSMQGREAGTYGNVKGTYYLATEAHRLGLKPAGDSGTYFQTVPLIAQGVVPSSASFTIGSQSLALWSEFSPVPGIGGNMPREMNDTAVQFIFAGRAGEPYQLSFEQAAGKFVIFLPPPDSIRKDAPKAQAAVRRYPPRADNGLALGYAGLDIMSAARRESLKTSQVIFAPGQDIPKPTGQPIMYLSAAALQKIFGKPVDQLRAGDVGVTRASITYTFAFAPSLQPARNVVAILPGSDPVLSKTYVAIGAHNDHEGVTQTAVDHDSLKAFNQIARITGAEGSPIITPENTTTINALIAEMRKTNPPRRDSIFNGADDDASGSMSVLEVAEYLASLKGKDRPKRSVLFVWHTAEEKGLWGSTYFTDHPTVERDSIVAQLNVDMVGRGEPSDLPEGNPDYLLLIGSRRLSTELGDLVESVNTQGKHNLKLDYSLDTNGHPANIYCRSDHYSYARYGIPITFFTTGVHPDYHQLTDEPQYINYEHMSRVTKFIGDITLNIANRKTRPVVDKPKPDPLGVCQQ